MDDPIGDGRFLIEGGHSPDAFIGSGLSVTEEDRKEGIIWNAVSVKRANSRYLKSALTIGLECSAFKFNPLQH